MTLFQLLFYHIVCVCVGGYTSIVVWVGTMCVCEYAHM